MLFGVKGRLLTNINNMSFDVRTGLNTKDLEGFDEEEEEEEELDIDDEDEDFD